MPKSKLKNAAKKHILIQSRNNDGRFLAADPEYNNLEYSNSELLVYESESSNEKEFNNGEMELSKEEAECLEISQQVFKHGSWIAHLIRERTKSWITTETLPVSKQGQRKYIPTLIDDEDNYVQNNVLPHITSSCTSISLETDRTWLCHLGLSRLHDSWFINEQGEQITQPMIFPEDLSPDDSNYIFHSQPKGIQQVWSYMNAYRRRLTGWVPEYTIHKYCSYRHIPNEIDLEFSRSIIMLGWL
ncbi:17276_t:CDS:2 [Dentiscutata heterogama]|uniref:17276_t:CDS:1 n=1 Tax=Dentiscutata heterogama TaxID=1316150 RepID=A0ACA9L1J6_9GLOM|nr:17276_t:CDS:2 [Dentiscutata heterogama]